MVDLAVQVTCVLSLYDVNIIIFWLIIDILIQTDFREVLRQFWPVRHMWENIGVELNMDEATLVSIREDNPRDVGKCFSELLRKYLKRGFPKPSWGDLIRAIRGPTVDQGHVADHIENNMGARLRNWSLHRQGGIYFRNTTVT